MIEQMLLDLNVHTGTKEEGKKDESPRLNITMATKSNYNQQQTNLAIGVSNASVEFLAVDN